VPPLIDANNNVVTRLISFMVSFLQTLKLALIRVVEALPSRRVRLGTYSANRRGT
jgi:hypothetical protein